MVIKDAYFSGWKAYLDDRRVPIIRVNGMARGVEVASAGTHVVKFYYQPFGFRLGLAGGSAAFLALTVILMMYGRGLSSRLEVGIVCCGTACLIFILVAIFLITRTDDGPIQLGSENVSAINLTEVKLKWRRTDRLKAANCLRAESRYRVFRSQLTAITSYPCISATLYMLRMWGSPRLI